MVTEVNNFSDFAGLARLRAEGAAETDPQVTREAARQFEALFVQMMLKSMREAGAILGDSTEGHYRDMFDQQVAMEMTRDKGIGIAEMLVRQLKPGDRTETDAQVQNMPLPRTAARARAVQNAAELANAVSDAVSREDFRPANVQEFISGIWSHAQQAAEKIGADVRALVAQAALETGWGQHQIRDGQGVSINNLFGIKAGSTWTGDRQAVTTLEYEDGMAVRQRAEFRAYANLTEAFNDYVDFLTSHPRYQGALEHASDARAFVEELQNAGYATDPEYADKILNIMENPGFDQEMSQLKKTGEVPTPM